MNIGYSIEIHNIAEGDAHFAIVISDVRIEIPTRYAIVGLFVIIGGGRRKATYQPTPTARELTW
jgi:hypothetical protein